MILGSDFDYQIFLIIFENFYLFFNSNIDIFKMFIV